MGRCLERKFAIWGGKRKVNERKLSDVGASFELVKDVIGIKEEKEMQVFTGKPKVECAVCADVPNLMDIDLS